MRATKSQVKNHLKDPAGYVTNFAAYALVLMEANEYASEVIPLVENAYTNNVYLGPGDFHPIVEEELVKIRSRFSESFLKMKSQRKN